MSKKDITLIHVEYNKYGDMLPLLIKKTKNIIYDKFLKNNLTQIKSKINFSKKHFSNFLIKKSNKSTGPCSISTKILKLLFLLKILFVFFFVFFV